jgi:hypothetical protein
VSRRKKRRRAWRRGRCCRCRCSRSAAASRSGPIARHAAAPSGPPIAACSFPNIGWWARRAIRSATDRQLCLIDSDGDGRADQSLVVGDGPPALRTPRAIAPVAIDIADLVPISSNDRVQLKLTRVGRDWAELTLIILQEGHPRRFDEMSGPWGDSLRVSRVTQGGPGSIIGADFSLLTVDRDTRTARIEWPAGVDPRRFAVIPDRLDLVRR